MISWQSFWKLRWNYRYLADLTHNNITFSKCLTDGMQYNKMYCRYSYGSLHFFWTTLLFAPSGTELPVQASLEAFQKKLTSHCQPVNQLLNNQAPMLPTSLLPNPWQKSWKLDICLRLLALRTGRNFGEKALDCGPLYEKKQYHWALTESLHASIWQKMRINWGK